jgi:hypothetical protein
MVGIVCQKLEKSSVEGLPMSTIGALSSGNLIWLWVNTYRYIFSGMNIHLPAILGFTRYQGFDPSPSKCLCKGGSVWSQWLPKGVDASPTSPVQSLSESPKVEDAEPRQRRLVPLVNMEAGGRT